MGPPQGLLLMDSELGKFVSRPWTATILILALGLLAYCSYGTVKTIRREREAASTSAAGAA